MDHEMRGGPADRFECEMPATASSLARLRRLFSCWAGGAVEDVELRADLVLVLSEMAASTLPSWTASDDDAPVSQRVRAVAWRDSDGVVLEIDGDVAPVDAAEREFHRAAETTRGMAIVASLADVFSVRRRDDAKQLRARLARPQLRMREAATR